jgi:hypothetical protein
MPSDSANHPPNTPVENTALESMSPKSQTARANGARSRGPVTPQGRARSSRNSLRHGLSAQYVVLPSESAQDFQLHLDAHLDTFRPRTGVEIELVKTMAVARWRLRRLGAIETNILSTELVRREEDIDDEFSEMQGEDRLAWVFQYMADHGQSLALLMRYEGAISRAYDRAFKQLLILQRAPAPPDPEVCEPHPPAEPEPVPESADVAVESAIKNRPRQNEPKSAADLRRQPARDIGHNRNVCSPHTRRPRAAIRTRPFWRLSAFSRPAVSQF